MFCSIILKLSLVEVQPGRNVDIARDGLLKKKTYVKLRTLKLKYYTTKHNEVTV